MMGSCLTLMRPGEDVPPRLTFFLLLLLDAALFTVLFSFSIPLKLLLEALSHFQSLSYLTPHCGVASLAWALTCNVVDLRYAPVFGFGMFQF